MDPRPNHLLKRQRSVKAHAGFQSSEATPTAPHQHRMPKRTRLPPSPLSGGSVTVPQFQSSREATRNASAACGLGIVLVVRSLRPRSSSLASPMGPSQRTRPSHRPSPRGRVWRGAAFSPRHLITARVRGEKGGNREEAFHAPRAQLPTCRIRPAPAVRLHACSACGRRFRSRKHSLE